VKRFHGGLQHVGFVDALPSDGIAVLLGQLADEFAPGAAIAFAQIVRGPAAERGSVQLSKAALLGKLPKERRGRVFNVVVIGEHVAASADFDGPQFSGPILHIAEQMLMDGLQVLQVKAGDTEAVLENAG